MNLLHSIERDIEQVLCGDWPNIYFRRTTAPHIHLPAFFVWDHISFIKRTFPRREFRGPFYCNLRLLGILMYRLFIMYLVVSFAKKSFVDSVIFIHCFYIVQQNFSISVMHILVKGYLGPYSILTKEFN